MGSYLSQPVTEKETSDGSNERLKYGASWMQGWRVSQEDAHNCILDYEADASFFAVYDGHGGHEVAEYCSDKLPQFIKDTEAYKNGDLRQALIDGFLGFDATIATQEVIDCLKEIAGDREADEESDDEENVMNLYEEAEMPIEEVIEKYTSNSINPSVKNLKKDGNKMPKSPYLKAKKEKADEATVGTSAACSSGSSSNATECNDGVSSSSGAEANSSTESIDTKSTIRNGADTVPDSSDMKEADASNECKESKDVKTENTNTTVNGEADSEAQAKNDVTSTLENGEIITKKGKGKAPLVKGEIKAPRKSPRTQRNAKQLYKQWLDFGEESEDTDEDDQTFEEPNESSSDDDEVNTTTGGDNSDESSEPSADEGGEEDEDDEEDDEGLAFIRGMKEGPGSDSGCTAVVALLKGDELYVANAGDSRCIVCRAGKAVEMSLDHKPEDEPERARVVKAGGFVSAEGRVDGGLNLSRAIGDHSYKQNKTLSDREQMITALPDVRTLTIDTKQDEFMVLACDGIWNSMSSQEVVDFVRPRLEKCEDDKLSKICGELFDHCLAPNTIGDGTGCDNMTAIIVQFRSNALKRPATLSPDAEEHNSKRAKTENQEQIDTTV